MIKLLVAHENPDLDAIGACWLFTHFGGHEFNQVEYYFVHAGDQIDSLTIKEKGLHQEEIIHVDTGLGQFDHHQPHNQAHDSASLRVYQHLAKQFPEVNIDQALKRVVGFINETDHFASYYYPESAKDRYLFMLEDILSGLRSGKHFTDRELIEFGMVCLDGVYTSMKIRVKAEVDLDTTGYEFISSFGKSLAIENKNDEVIKLAQKRGYALVVRKDQDNGGVRIKTAPDPNLNLKKVYDQIKAIDLEGHWYYHPSGHMLLNGSKKHTGQTPTKLTLQKVVNIIKG